MKVFYAISFVAVLSCLESCNQKHQFFNGIDSPTDKPTAVDTTQENNSILASDRRETEIDVDLSSIDTGLESKLFEIPSNLTKVIFLIDNSASMAVQQRRLADLVPDLVDGLKGMNFEAYIYSSTATEFVHDENRFDKANNERRFPVPLIYGHDGRWHVGIKTLANVYRMKTFDRATSTESYRYLDVLDPSIILSKNDLDTTAEAFTLETKFDLNQGFIDSPIHFQKNLEDKLFKSKIAELSEGIVNTGVTGSSYEESVCTLVRLLGDTSGNSPLSKGDRVAVLLISDQDDQSIWQTCLQKMETTYEIDRKKPFIEKNCTEDCDEYLYYYQLDNRYFSGQCESESVQDGKLVSKTMSFSGNIYLEEQKTTPSLFLTSEGDCDQVQRDYISNNLPSGCLAESLGKCNVRRQAFSYNRIVKLKEPDACNTPSIDVNGTLVTFGEWVMQTQIDDSKHVLLKDCKKGFGTKASTIVAASLVEEKHIDFRSDQESGLSMHEWINERAEAKFGANFHFSAIVPTEDGNRDCLTDIDRVETGSSFIEQASILGAQGTTTDICSKNLADATKPIRRQVANTIIETGDIDPNKIEAIRLVRNGAVILLDAKAYKLEPGRVLLDAAKYLDGDQLEILFKPEL